MPTRGETHATRLGALEEGYEALGREIHGLRQDFADFAREIRRELAIRGRTQWAPLIAAGALVVTILGGLIALGARGPISDLERIDRHGERLESRLDRVEVRDAAGDALVEVLEKEVLRMRDRLLGVQATRFTGEHGERLRAELLAEIRRIDARIERLRPPNGGR